MGSAIAYHLSRQELRVLGIDRHPPIHDRGSSHGRSRVIRKAYFEDPRYIPMLHRAYELWRELEQTTGERILNLCGVLNIGPPNHSCLQGAKRSAIEHGLPFEELNATEISQRWPALVPAKGDVGIFEADGGILTPEAAVRCHLELAERHGATFRWEESVQEWSTFGRELCVRTDRGDYTARHLVIAAGAWLGGFTADLNLPLRVERQIQLWWTPKDAAICRTDRLPAFIHFKDDRAYYGTPMRDGDPGIKIARHHGGDTTTPDAIDRSLQPKDEADVRDYIRQHVSTADGPLAAHSICMYTNTSDDHFILDRHPKHENVIIAGGFSGHGFKFTPLVGEFVADWVTMKKETPDIKLFSLKRFVNT